jgi:thiamine kinase-like enzyme
MMDAATPDVDVRSHIAALPFWRSPVSIEPLVGGLCNKNFIAEASSQKYVVRVGRDIPVHGISQALVQNAMRAAAEVGVSPALRFASGPVTVSDFIDGRHLRPDDMQDDAILAGLVRRIRELHAGGAAIDGLLPYFWPFQVVRIYARYLKENKSRIVADVDALANHANALERLVSPFHPVFTHNDLVPQNVMIDKAGTLFLIDWDYGAYGHPLFDVAAITANIDDDSEAIDAKILTHYFGGFRRDLEAVPHFQAGREFAGDAVGRRPGARIEARSRDRGSGHVVPLSRSRAGLCRLHRNEPQTVPPKPRTLQTPARLRIISSAIFLAASPPEQKRLQGAHEQ